MKTQTDVTSTGPTGSLEAFEETAFTIGAGLCRDAIWDGQRCNWLGASMEPIAGQWRVVDRSFGPDLYAGTSGMAYFLAHLYRTSREDVVRRTAEGAMRAALSRLEAIPEPARLGFYTGLTGVAFVSFTLGDAFERAEWRDQGLKLLDQVLVLEPEHQGVDVLAGVAGAIPALLSMADRDPRVLDRAVVLGDHLCRIASRRDLGWSWDTLGNQALAKDHLTGFSHGSCGIAWALLELAEVTGAERFREAADEGFRYSRHWFDAAVENWPDLRRMDNFLPAGGGSQQAGEQIYPIQWCHGAPGAGMARLRAFQLTGDEVRLKEAEAAIRTTCRDLQEGKGQTNFSLCHGYAGNAELLLLADQMLGKTEYAQAARGVGSMGIRRYGQPGHEWPSGVQGGLGAPGLMLGAAGTGYFYLRLAKPEMFPSILLPPVA